MAGGLNEAVHLGNKRAEALGAYLQTGRVVSLRRAAGDEAISFLDKDCFAEFILSVVEGLAMTRRLKFTDTLAPTNFFAALLLLLVTFIFIATGRPAVGLSTGCGRYPLSLLHHLRRPFEPLVGVVEHQVENLVAFFGEDDAVVALRQMRVQHRFHCRPYT